MNLETRRSALLPSAPQRASPRESGPPAPPHPRQGWCCVGGRTSPVPSRPRGWTARHSPSPTCPGKRRGRREGSGRAPGLRQSPFPLPELMNEDGIISIYLFITLVSGSVCVGVAKE